jgi:hypothetical protein
VNERRVSCVVHDVPANLREPMSFFSTPAALLPLTPAPGNVGISRGLETDGLAGIYPTA